MEILTAIFRGLFGVAGILGIAWVLSNRRGAVDWRLVLGGLALQLLLAVLALRAPVFRDFIGWISGLFVALLGFTDEGSAFVFGPLVDSENLGFVFACKILPTVIFVSALTSLLYYYGILQRVVFGLAWVMKRVMRLSGAESLAAAANIFVGQTEAPLVIKPYVPRMTRSELMSLMVGGMATIAGGVLASYIGLLGGEDEASRREFATLLLCASLMSAPAALLIAKIMIPETEEVDQNLAVPRDRSGTNALDALARGTGEGLKLALNIAAMLIVFIALIAMIDGVLGWVGGWGGDPDSGAAGWLDSGVQSGTGGVYSGLSLGAIIGFLFAPVAWLIGIEGGNLLQAGEILGLKMAANEFVAYTELAEVKAELSRRSTAILTFALCGFANFSSIGIQLGGIGVLAPERRADLAALGFRAMIGGTLAALLTAAIAGMFYP